jgi:hypothetical protein
VHQLLVGAVAAVQRIGAVARLPDEAVVPGAEQDAVVARPAVDDVVAGAGDDHDAMEPPPVDAELGAAVAADVDLELVAGPAEPDGVGGRRPGDGQGVVADVDVDARGRLRRLGAGGEHEAGQKRPGEREG